MATPMGTPAEEAGQDLLEVGRALAARPRSVRQLVRAGQDRCMAQLQRRPSLQAALFRTVDVAPACGSPSELSHHIAALLEQASAYGDGPARQPGVRALTRISSRRGLDSVVGSAAALAVRAMAGRFIVAEDAAAAAPELTKLWRAGVATSIDLLGEATVTYEEGRAYGRRCMETLDVLCRAAEAWPSAPLLETDSIGPIARVNLSVKVSALTPLLRPHAPQRARADAAPLLRDIFRRARELGAHVHVDMESLDSRAAITDLVLETLSEREFRDGPSIGLVLQAYLRDSEQFLDDLLERFAAIDRRPPLTIRLVKGAYWDHEVIQSAQHGWPSPVWSRKAESDRSFERLSRRLIDAFPAVRPAFASHNLRSLSHAIVYARSRGLRTEDIELQVLRGLGDDLQDAAVKAGFRVRTYCPVGDLVTGMAYLVRRLLENSSNDSFLMNRVSAKNIDELLVEP